MTPEHAKSLKVPDHWKERCAERAPGVCPEELYRGIVWAVANRRDDLVQFVKNDGTADYYRVATPAGIFFVPMGPGFSHYLWPITVYTRAMFRQVRKRFKNRRRHNREGTWTGYCENANTRID